MKIYINYLKYLLNHKRNVFIECWRRGLYLHAFTHDLSKFLPSEFIPYALYFGVDAEDIELRADYQLTFDEAWEKHCKRNKHHPAYWYNKNYSDMPKKYVAQMVCDLKAMSRKFGGSAQQYYLKQYFNWKITPLTRFRIEGELGLICQGSYDHKKALGIPCSIAEQYETLLNKLGEERADRLFKILYKDLYEKYDVDILKIFKDSDIIFSFVEPEGR